MQGVQQNQVQWFILGHFTEHMDCSGLYCRGLYTDCEIVIREIVFCPFRTSPYTHYFISLKKIKVIPSEKHDLRVNKNQEFLKLWTCPTKVDVLGAALKSGFQGRENGIFDQGWCHHLDT